MARIRTLKPEFWRHEALCELPEATHMMAAALLNYSDDHGYFNANPKLIQGEIYPLREPSVSIPESLRRLQTINYIRLGTGSDGRRYGQVIEFSKHQKVSHPTDSKISCLSITWDNSGEIPESSVRPQEIFGPEQGTGNKEQGTGKVAADAAPARKRASKPADVEPEGFAEFYQAYPKHEDRIDAAKAYREAIKKAAPEIILQGAKRYASEKRGVEKEFIKLPAGWLRNQRWNDGDDGKPRVKAGFHSSEEMEAQRLMKERMHGQTTQ